MAKNISIGAKRISAEAAADLVQSGMSLDYGATLCQPDVFDAALARRAEALDDVKIRYCLSVRPRAFLEADPDHDRFIPTNWHFSGYDRQTLKGRSWCYAPLNLGEAPDYYNRLLEPTDIVVLKVRPMDGNGWFNFGPTNLWHRALVERARTIIVELCDTLPHACGEYNGVHLSEVDHVIDGDHASLPELPNPSPTSIDRDVARHVIGEIEDGCCLQIGIGAMPNAVCSLLMEGGVRDIGVHTEMLTDGILELYQSGVVTGAQKKLYPGKMTYTFALGSTDLYHAIDRNSDMMCLPVDQTNLPHLIMQNDKVISINSTTEIDLHGQAASESDGRRHLTGTGGQLQFVRGAYASKGGKSFICMPSTYEKGDIRKSRIVCTLTSGNIVTTPRTDIMYVATEYGVVNLKGASGAERSRLLISIAHPDFREELSRQAFEQGLAPRLYAGARLSA